MTEHPAAEHPSPVTPQNPYANQLRRLAGQSIPADSLNALLDAALRTAADAARKEVVDAIGHERFGRLRLWSRTHAQMRDHGSIPSDIQEVLRILDSLARPVEEERK